MQIIVKMSSGKTISMTVAKTNTTAYIKAKIQQLKNIPVDEQRLYYFGKELQDGYTLSESNIQKESELLSARAKKAFLSFVS